MKDEPMKTNLSEHTFVWATIHGMAIRGIGPRGTPKIICLNHDEVCSLGQFLHGEPSPVVPPYHWLGAAAE